MIAMRTLLTRSILAAFVGFLALTAEPMGRAQDIMLPGDVPPRVKKRKPKPDVLPIAPSQSPSFTIPVGPLGYGVPSPTYLGRHYTLFALEFLDDNRLLFSLRAPGLLARDADEASADRQMKAVLLKVPEGTVESQTNWTVPDRARFLWALGDSRFLLRDRNGLKIGDATLQTKLLLQLTGEFVSLQKDPGGKIIAVHTLEHSGSNSTAPTEIVTRIVRTDSGEVLQTTHTSALVEPPINSEGSLEVVHDNKYDQWSLKQTSFTGGTKILGHIESTCLPNTSFVSDAEILVAGCDQARIPKLTIVSTSGQTVWQLEGNVVYVSPLLTAIPNGQRFARESIILKKKPSSDTGMLWVKAVKGQVVRVFDTATGKLLLETPISPILDGGGNVAVSPSGRRLAVLNHGSIQVFDLPALFN